MARTVEKLCKTASEPATTRAFTGSHRDGFCGGKSLNRLREEVFQYHSVSLSGFVFQACLIDRSSISPFRISDLWSPKVADSADCEVLQCAEITYGLFQYSRAINARSVKRRGALSFAN